MGSRFHISLNANRHGIYVNPHWLERQVDRDFRSLSQKDKIQIKKGFKDLTPFFDRLPKTEADAIILFFINHIRQVDIAKMLGITQGHVSGIIRKGIQRLQFLKDYPVLDTQIMEKDLLKILNQGWWNHIIATKVAMGMYETACQSEVAKELNIHQSSVRDYFFRAIEKLEPWQNKKPIYKTYYRALRMVQANPNILRKVRQSRSTAWKVKERHIINVKTSVLLKVIPKPPYS